MITNKNLRFNLSLIILFIFTSCNSQPNIVTKDGLIFYEFPKKITIEFAKEIKLNNAFIRQINFYNKNLLLTNMSENYPFVFSIYNPESKKIENTFVKMGTKNNEAIAPLSSGVLNNETVWLHDLSLAKIVQYKIPTNTKDSLSYVTNKIDASYYSSQLVNQNTAYGFSPHNNRLDKIQEINFINKKETDLYGAFEKMPNNFTDGSWKHAHEGFLFSNPTKNKFVFACKLMDKFYILDTLTKKSYTIVGPHHHKLNVKPVKMNGMDIAMTDEKTKLAYLNGYCTKQYIYLLYTQSYDMQPKGDQGTAIYVFDWNGNPVASLTFKNGITAFAITNDDKKLYAFEPDTQEIISATIKF